MLGVNRWTGVHENGRVDCAKVLLEGRRVGLVAVVASRAAIGSMPENLAREIEDERRREATVGGL